MYSKCPKISNTISFFGGPKFCLLCSSFLKILSGMGNSVDPDQTAQSDLGLHCLHIPFCQILWCMRF